MRANGKNCNNCVKKIENKSSSYTIYNPYSNRKKSIMYIMLVQVLQAAA